MKRVLTNLTFWVLNAIVIGVLIGRFSPNTGVGLKVLADWFIKIIQCFICPIIFLTIVLGIAGMGNLKSVGRVGAKALIYFELVTSLALVSGIAVAHVLQPGAGIDFSKFGGVDISDYRNKAEQFTWLKFLGDNLTLQVLAGSLVVGFALNYLPRRIEVVTILERISHYVFRALRLVMWIAPLGALGGVAFTVGKYGLASLMPLGWLMLSVYCTMAVFIFGVLALILRWCGVGIWRYLAHIKDEILLVLGTSSSEAALPQLMKKLEDLGCPRSIVGLVVPAGYSFNLDGTTIYLSMAVMFLAQVFHVEMGTGQILALIGILAVTSKGAAGVTGSGFVILASTLKTVNIVPIEGLALLVGVDRFMSEARSITNVIGNGVAAIAIAKHEGTLKLPPCNTSADSPPEPFPTAAGGRR